jgi:uroporphyrinogen decarboxylase
MLANYMVAAREAGVSMQQFRTDPAAILRTFVGAVEKYQCDSVYMTIDVATVAGALGVEIDFPNDGPARWLGPALKDLSETMELEPPNVAAYWEAQVWAEATNLLKSYFGDEILVRGDCDQAPFSLACAMRGLEQWMVDLAERRHLEFAHRLLQYCTDASKQFISLIVAAGADMVSTGDSPAGPDMISPRMYREFAFPYEQQVVRHAHSLGVPHVLHICGDTTLLLEDMVATGSDGLELDYKTDVNRAHDVLKNNTTLVGNLDPAGVITFGSTALVEQKTRELLEVFSDTPRFILAAGCDIPPDAPAENLQAMVRVARDFTA